MGLDQYAGLRDSNGEVHGEFYWRKHARLQQFFSREFEKQKGEKDHNSSDGWQHLGFNAGEGGVKITEDVVKRLEEQYKNNFYDCFAHSGFFWGQQFQEEQVNEYKAQDKKFIAWCKKMLKEGKEIGYDCSW